MKKQSVIQFQQLWRAQIGRNVTLSENTDNKLVDTVMISSLWKMDHHHITHLLFEDGFKKDFQQS